VQSLQSSRPYKIRWLKNLLQRLHCRADISHQRVWVIERVCNENVPRGPRNIAASSHCRPLAVRVPLYIACHEANLTSVRIGRSEVRFAWVHQSLHASVASSIFYDHDALCFLHLATDRADEALFERPVDGWCLTAPRIVESPTGRVAAESTGTRAQVAAIPRVAALRKGCEPYLSL